MSVAFPSIIITGLETTSLYADYFIVYRYSDSAGTIPADFQHIGCISNGLTGNDYKRIQSTIGVFPELTEGVTYYFRAGTYYNGITSAMSNVVSFVASATPSTSSTLQAYPFNIVFKPNIAISSPYIDPSSPYWPGPGVITPTEAAVQIDMTGTLILPCAIVSLSTTYTTGTDVPTDPISFTESGVVVDATSVDEQGNFTGFSLWFNLVVGNTYSFYTRAEDASGVLYPWVLIGTQVIAVNPTSATNFKAPVLGGIYLQTVIST